MFEAFFNYVVVIESLSDEDIKTGRNIYENNLLHINSKYPNLDSQFIQVRTSEEFLSCLRLLHEKVIKEGKIPFIDIKCHGNEEGLSMADGSFLPWNRFRNLLIKINRASKLNTIILIGACKGVHLLKSASTMDGAPFSAIIGTDAEVSNDEIESCLSSFYTTLFNERDANSALKAINIGIKDKGKDFYFISSEHYFVKCFKEYLSKYCQGKGKKTRVEHLVSRVMQEKNIDVDSIKSARNYIKKNLSNPKKDFDFFVSRFFFANEIPEILSTLSLDYDAIVRDLKDEQY